MNQYMVEMEVPRPVNEEFMSLIPEQRQAVSTLFGRGKLISYSLDQERSKLWIIMTASSESELVLLLDELPMTMYMDYQYFELMFHETISMIPTMSMN